MKNKNIVFLTKRFYTNKDLILDHFGRNYELPVGLARRDFNVSVICWDYRTSLTFDERHENVHFFNLSCRGLGFFTFILKTLQILKRLHPQCIIGSGDSYFGFLALVLGNIYKAKSIFDVYDFYPCFGSNRLPGMKKMFYLALKHSDYNYCASKALVEVAKKFNTNVLYIPNAVNLELFKTHNSKDIRAQLNLSPDFIYIGYFGSITIDLGITDLLKAFEKLHKENKNIYLLIAGKNTDAINLAEDGVIYLGLLNQTQVAQYICASDIVTMPYRNSVQVQYGNACKVMEYIACEKPIVATDVRCFTENYPEINWQEFDGALCNSNDIEDLARALNWQLKNQYQLPRKIIVTWDDLADQLVQII